MKNLYSIILVSFLVVVSAVAAAGVTLAWDANCDPSVTGYKVYYGTNGVAATNIVAAYTDDCGILRPAYTNVSHMPYTVAIPTTGGRTNCTLAITNLAPGITYSFSVTAVDNAGLESDFSSEVTYTVPLVVTPISPTKLRFP